MWTAKASAAQVCLLFNSKDCQDRCVTALQHLSDYMSDFWSCFTTAALSVSIPFAFFVCEDHVSDWFCHFKGLPQFAWRNTMEILSVLHLTWNTVRALEACFHVAVWKNVFWGPQTGWDTAAVPIFPRTEHLCCLALGPATLVDKAVSAERTPAFTLFTCRENRCSFPDQFAPTAQ